jgi:hypothetical protein
MTYRIRCKMICHSVEPLPTGDLSKVTFGVVWSPDTGKPEDENAVFGKYTPWGTYTAGWDSTVAAKLEVGKAYYVDFTPAE